MDSADFGGQNVWHGFWPHKGFFHSLEACMGYCQAVDKCVIAMYEAQSNWCFLKREEGDRTVKASMVSAYKVSRKNII